MGGIGRGGLIRNLSTTGGNTRREWGDVRQTTNGCSAICEKATKREEMEATSNIPILAVIIFSGSTGGDESQKSGGQEVFFGGGRSRTTVASMDAWWSDGEVGSGGGNRCRRISLIDGRGETRSCETVSPPKPRERRTLSVAVVEAKKESWAQNCEGVKVKRDDK